MREESVQMDYLFLAWREPHRAFEKKTIISLSLPFPFVSTPASSLEARLQPLQVRIRRLTMCRRRLDFSEIGLRDVDVGSIRMGDVQMVGPCHSQI